ncbi:MAG: formate dehydrogenase subunit alpha [Candidatus Heimdallarchaeota archaeon]|nr:formate dehydrogenase subunit alpha [Candidatus Heimdallarchaeota archaeon]
MLEVKTSLRIKVDDQEIIAFQDETYLEALQRANIYVPTMCYEKELIPSGACRLCIIEVESTGKLVSACTTPVADNSVIYTKNKRINKAREVLLELILADHPLICTVCDKQGNCTLQALAYEYVPAEKLKKYMDPDDKISDLVEENEFFKLDYSMCIKCGKCVQVVEELQHCGVLTMQGRGVNVFPTPGFDRTFAEAGCVACGNCVTVCPVDALKPLSIENLERKGREVDSIRTTTTCVYCGVGCQFEIVTNKRTNKIVYVDSNSNNEVNGLALCVKGRYGWDFIDHPDRLKYPLIKKNGVLEKATWDEAYDYIESKYRLILSEHGPEAFAFLSSAKCTNEENYLMQKLSRAAIGTNNIDHCARLCHASTVTGLIRTLGSGAMTNSIDDLTNEAKVIFVIGSNTTEAHPVIGVKIKQAVHQGKTELIVADPRQIELARMAKIHLQQRPGTDVAIINAMLKVIFDEGLIDSDFIANRTEGFEKLKEKIDSENLDELCVIAGVPKEKVIDAARLYAKAETAAIVYSMGITQHSTGTYNVVSLANLAMTTGHIGKPGTGINPLRGQNNVQGACDVGALPDVYPGYLRVDNPSSTEFFKDAWNKDTLSQIPGLTVVEIMQAAAIGKIKVMHIMGENPALSDPNINKVRDALNTVDFLVVHDLFLTETAKYADVVLPVMSFAEKDGTFTNTERRVQRVRKALNPIGDIKADWEILIELLNRFGVPSNYKSVSEIFDELAQFTGIYKGMNYERIDKIGLQWPCLDENDPGTKVLHTNTFTLGKGRMIPVDFEGAAELPDDEYPLVLTTGRNLYHFHTGEMTHRSKGLHERRPYETTELNPKDAERLGIKEGEKMLIKSRRGELVTVAKITKKILEGVVFMTFHHKEAAANLLTNDVLDPFAKIPELKVCAVHVEKHEEKITIESSLE